MSRRVVLFVVCSVAVLAVGCGSDDGGRGEAEPEATTTVVVTQTATVTTTTVAETTSQETTTSSDLSLEGFETPSGNIRCVAALGGGFDPHMRCTLGELSNEPPPRPASCEGDWGFYFTLEATGSGERACVSDAMVPDSGYVTLAYGTAWTRGPFTCRSRVSGVRCTNPEGHGLFLSRERQRLF